MLCDQELLPGRVQVRFPIFAPTPHINCRQAFGGGHGHFSRTTLVPDLIAAVAPGHAHGEVIGSGFHILHRLRKEGLDLIQEYPLEPRFAFIFLDQGFTSEPGIIGTCGQEGLNPGKGLAKISRGLLGLSTGVAREEPGIYRGARKLGTLALVRGDRGQT